MLAQMLYVQWRWSRDLLAFFVVAGVVLPLLLYSLVLRDVDLMTGGRIVGSAALVLSLLAGAVIAAQGYGVDDRAGHVYALSLPCTRAWFLSARSATAFLLLALPALAIWVGGLLTVAQLDVPPMMRSYAGSLALRALLTAWLAHSAIFALRYAAGRRAKIVLAVLLVVYAVFVMIPATRGFMVGAVDFLTSPTGPLGIVFGRWALIDV